VRVALTVSAISTPGTPSRQKESPFAEANGLSGASC
jgi:hypothetical protein